MALETRLYSGRARIWQALSETGERLGRVHDVHCDAGRVTALMCGPSSLIERWTRRKRGRRIPWDEVRRVKPHANIVA